MTLYDRAVADAQMHLKAVDTITAKAQRDGHITKSDERQADRHLSLARQAAANAKQAKSDDQMRKMIHELGEGIGMHSDDTPSVPDGPRAKALGGTSWGAEVLAAHRTATGRTKALTPAGSINVTVPLAVEPVTDAVPVYSVRQLIPAQRDDVGQYAYMRQTLRDHAAAPVAIGAKKPTSRYNMVRVNGRSVTLAHLSEPLPRQDLADAPMLQAFIDAEMRAGLEEALEQQIVSGDGTGENFTGLASTSGIQSQPWVTDHLVTTRSAVTKLETFSMAGTGWLLHPLDWQALELASNSAGFVGAQAGQGTPVDRMARRLWGIPVVPTVAVPAGTGFLADFAGSTRLWVREEVDLTWSENVWRPDALGAGQGASDFERNMITWRAEGRFGFAVTRPLGVVELDLTAA